MRFKSLFGIRSAIVGCALIAGITLGVIVSGYTTGALAKSFEQAPAHVYQKNASGQTYGSGMDAASVGSMPDLISARGEDGTLGYIRLTDLKKDQPKNPKEAVAYQLKRDSDRKAGKLSEQIPLYDVDGKTVIGVFNIRCCLSRNLAGRFSPPMT